MDYKNKDSSVNNRVDDLLSRMTVSEKIMQLTSVGLGEVISDLKNHKFSYELAHENISEGCGYMGRIGGSTDLYPQEMAELMNQIQEYFIEETRLGIPVIFLTEATSGVLSRNHTHFPQNIGVGAMFDEQPVREMGDVIRKEMTATGERMALAPVVDVIRDHRYGRFEESFGEDKYLTSQYGKAYTEGIQSENLKNGVVATLKHFVVQGISDGGRNCAPVHVSEKEILDDYAVPFAAAINDANAEAVMAAYHEIDQVPCHASRKVMKDILRNKIDFKGLIISDGSGIQLLHSFQEYCASETEAAKLALKAGIELELDSMYKKYLEKLLEKEQVTVKLLDKAVMKVLSLKFRLGLFDDPYVDEKKVKEKVAVSENINTSRKMALKSMTLLKNNDILPLSGNEESIAVIGPLADNKKFAYGDYSYPTHFEEVFSKSDELPEEEILARSLFYKKPDTEYKELFHEGKTVLEAVKEYVSSETEVYHAAGLKDTYNYYDWEDFYELDAAVKTASQAEVIVAVCGDTSGMGPENDSGESMDRTEITLSKAQRQLLKELSKLNKPVILVLCNGRPLELSYESKNMEAILEAWKPGMRGGEAICEVLFGNYNPGGRLPVTLPKTLGQLPVYYSQRPTGKKQFWRNTYLETDLDPLYEFGYGLSYTYFTYQNIEMYKKENLVKVRVTVENSGDYDGEEVIQVYVRKKYTSVLQPERELQGYKRIFIKKGNKVTVEFEINFSSLCYHDKNDDLVLENCELEVMVGASSQNIKGQQTFELRFAGGKKKFSGRTFTNKVSVVN